MKHQLAVVLLAAFMFGCSKFKHSENIVNYCKSCDYADSLEGTYRGIASGLMVDDEENIWSDSLFITVDHYFKNKGSYYDSTVMCLKLTYYFQATADSYDTYMEMHDGHLFKSNFDVYSITPTEFRMHEEFVSHFNPGVSQLFVDYLGIKQ